jgi:Domain of unknown function (DUF4145)
MDCPHCGKAFHDSWNDVPFLAIGQKTWHVKSTTCPACLRPAIDFEIQSGVRTQSGQIVQKRDDTFRVYPRNSFRKPTPPEVPKNLKEDYEEACEVLPISEKASAALSRRCLQSLLREHGYTEKDLAKQIDSLLAEPDSARAVPTGLRNAVDAIRNYGNFSAHPVTDQTTLQVIEVQPGEAEWCLEILEEMFDHYFVRPAQVAARKAALDAKLAKAGKPPSK